MEVDFKDALGQARSELNVGLRGWQSPNARMLPTNPAHAASCLRLALRYGHSQVAFAAVKTMALFAEHMLWETLLAYSANETAVHGPWPTLSVLAAKRDRAWMRRKGGLSRVAGYLVAALLKAPRSMDAIYLWRLSFDDPAAVPSNLQELALDACSLRKRMLALLGYEDEGGDERRKLDSLMRSSEDPLSVELAIAVFRQAFVPEALMVPLIRRQLSEIVSTNSVSDIGGHIVNTNARSERQIRWESTLTRDTPAGRKALREIIATLPKLRNSFEESGLAEEDSLEMLDELLQRQDEDAHPEKSSQIIGLRMASRWSGIGSLKPASAKGSDAILVANGSAVAEIHSAHIPPSLIGLA